MKILLVSSSSGSRGGGELYLLYLGESLAQKGHELVLWASSHSRMDELASSFSRFGEVRRSVYRNTYDHPLRSLGASLNFGISKKIANEWHKCGPDLIHINKQNLEDGLDLLRAASRLSIPSLCTIHLTQSAQYLGARFAPTRDFAAKRALKKFKGPLVTVLDNRKRNLSTFLGAEAGIHTIPNGVPVLDSTEMARFRAEKRAELALADEAPLLVAVGRMVPQKRPLLFLEKAEEILAHIPEAKFVWVGDGWLTDQWDQFVSERNLSHAVSRIPWQKDVRPFLAAADVFLHVAEYEGLPLALLEAMSAGLPCAVTSNLLKEMPFLNATNSIDVGDGPQWMGALGNPGELKRIGAASKELFLREFSYATMAARYEELYAVIVKGAG